MKRPSVKPPKSPKRVLLVRPDAIGDVVLMTPLIFTIKATFPECEIYTIQHPLTQDLYRHHPLVKDVIVDWNRSGKVSGIKGFFQYARYLKSLQFDMVIQPFLEPYYAALMVAARIPIRVGDGQKLGLRPYLTHPISLNFRDVYLHEIRSNIHLFKGVFPDAKVDERMTLFGDPEGDLSVDQLLRDHGWNGGPLVAVHPTTGGGNRAWDPVYWGQFVQKLIEDTEYQVILTGAGGKDGAVNETIMSCCKDPKRVVNLLNATTVDQLKLVLKRCEVVMGTDTGPTHMAAALGVKVLCISPTKFVKSLRWGPWGVVNRIVGKPQVCPLACFPYRCEERYCLESISVAHVFREFMALVQDSSEFNREKAVKDWERASVNVGLVCSGLSEACFKVLGRQIEQLKMDRRVFYVIVPSQACKEAFLCYFLDSVHPDQIVVFSRFDVRGLLRFVTSKDVNDVRLLGGKNQWLWSLVIRPIAALNMYVPPTVGTIQN